MPPLYQWVRKAGHLPCPHLSRSHAAGADLNKVNLNGETVLHFAYAYGFDELGDYLKTKGADDSILNIDGLTCYEGLHQDDVLDL